MAFPSYSTGTVSVSAGGTVVTGVGTLWTASNVRPGDDIVIDGRSVVVMDFTDATHLVIDPWPGGTVAAGAAYKLLQNSPLRYNASQVMMDVSQIVATMNTDGYFYYVKSSETAPNPSYGNEGQYAMQATTGKLWLKQGGVWVFIGINKGFGVPAPYDNTKTYNLYDVATFGGSSYVFINTTPSAGHAPPNATYWAVLASIGATGATGPTGPSYAATSTTSLAIGTGGKVFTTQAGLAYTNGARVRATSAANPANWMEGLATYSGTTLTISVTKTNGSGTLADWNFNLAGEPGAGDLSSANNLSDLANVALARGNLRLVDAPQGRLSLTSGVALPTIDVVGGISVYWVPQGGLFPVWDGSKFVMREAASQLVLTFDNNSAHAYAHLNNTICDLFLTLNPSGVPVLVTAPSWANAGGGVSSQGTGPGTAELDYSKGGIPTNKYAIACKFGTGAGDYFTQAVNQATHVGCVKFTGGHGLADDSATNRMLWNTYNQASRRLRRGESAPTWAYSASPAFQQANGNTANKVATLIGANSFPVSLKVNGCVTTSVSTNRGCQVGIGLNSTTVDSSSVFDYAQIYNGPANPKAEYNDFPPIGYNEFNWLEQGGGAGATETWYGLSGRTGLLGTIWN